MPTSDVQCQRLLSEISLPGTRFRSCLAVKHTADQWARVVDGAGPPLLVEEDTGAVIAVEQMAFDVAVNALDGRQRRDLGFTLCITQVDLDNHQFAAVAARREHRGARSRSRHALSLACHKHLCC